MARTLGIDIRKESLRATLAMTTMRKADILHYYEIPLVQTTSEAARAESVRGAFDELLAQITPPPDRIVAAVADEQVALRAVEIPAATLKRAAELLPFELENQLPFSIDDAVLDFQAITTEGAIAKLLTATVRSSDMARALADLEDAGIVPKEMAAGAVALDGLLPACPELSGDEGPELVLDVGQVRTELCVMHNGHCSWARSVSSGIEHVATGQLAADLRRSIASYRATGSPMFAKATLTGGGGADEHARPWFADKLGVPVHPLALPDAPGADPAVRPRFAYCTALACRASRRGHRIDLRQGEFAAKATENLLQRHAVRLGVAAAAITASFLFSVIVSWYNLSAENDSLRSQLGTLTKQAFNKRTESVSRARDLLEGKHRDESPLPSFDAYDALTEISSSIPADVKHDVRKLYVELDEDLQAGRINLNGSVPSLADLDKVVSSIESHECFNSVVKKTTSSASNGGVSYPLEAKILCPDSKKAKKGKD